MTRHGFLFPIGFNQIVTWRRVGVWLVREHDGVWVSMDIAGVLDVSESRIEKLVSVLPVYEDDFEVLYALIEDDFFLQKKLTGDSTVEELVPYAALTSLFPISERGLQLLRGKSDESLPLRTPLEFRQVASWEKDLRRRSRVEAGNELVRCFDLDGAGGLSAELEAEVIEAMRGHDLSPTDDSVLELVRRTVRYARQQRPDQKVIPNTDWGFLFDLGRIIQSTLPSADAGRPASERAKERLKTFREALEAAMPRMDRSRLGEIITSVGDPLSRLSDMCRPFDPVTILVFLKFRGLLDSGAANAPKDAAVVVRSLAGQRREAVATGVRLAGIWAGFPTVRAFCDQFSQGDYSLEPMETPERRELPPEPIAEVQGAAMAEKTDVGVDDVRGSSSSGQAAHEGATAGPSSSPSDVPSEVKQEEVEVGAPASSDTVCEAREEPSGRENDADNVAGTTAVGLKEVPAEEPADENSDKPKTRKRPRNPKSKSNSAKRPDQDLLSFEGDGDTEPE